MQKSTKLDTVLEVIGQAQFYSAITEHFIWSLASLDQMPSPRANNSASLSLQQLVAMPLKICKSRIRNSVNKITVDIFY